MSLPLRASGSILATTVLSFVGWSQAFQSAPGQIPQGPFNLGPSENVDFADVDLDGDFDAAIADGGDVGNHQNRLWLNRGGLQGGMQGFFDDATAAQCPAVLDASRDVEFGDLEGDGDFDLAVANHSGISNQGLRLWRNQGGAQGGTAGFFADATLGALAGLGGVGSSVHPGAVLPGGNYVSWSGDVEFGDLDGDGDLDLVVTEYGGLFSGNVPTRMFLNEGTGVFQELNPTGSTGGGQGLPGIWCQGLQTNNSLNATGTQCDVTTNGVDGDLADVDGDLDLDFLLGNLNSGDPRFFHNRSLETGTVIFRDVTGSVFPFNYAAGSDSYEQELGDLDGDEDVDLWGLSWANLNDETLRNAGNGLFGELAIVPNSGQDEEEVDFLDYDNDGDLDALVANFSGSELLYRNDLVGGNYQFSNVSVGNVPPSSSTSKDLDTCDVDGDGDYDAIVANGSSSEANELLQNITQVADVHAPRPAHLEQVPNRLASAAPTRVRVQVHGNAAYYVNWYDTVALEFSLNGGAFVSADMRNSGGNVFYGEIPGALVGAIQYRVRATDRYGNAAATAALGYSASGGSCNGSLSLYCAPKLNSFGCRPELSLQGYPSVGAGSGFLVRATNVVQTSFGVLVYSKTGPDSAPFQGGTLCVAAPTARTSVVSTNAASPCGGVLTVDFNAHIASGVDPALTAGQSFWGQIFFRDGADPTGLGLTNAVAGTICP
jgi:hypothetical protein